MTTSPDAIELAKAWADNPNDDFAPGSVRDDARTLARALLASVEENVRLAKVVEAIQAIRSVPDRTFSSPANARAVKHSRLVDEVFPLVDALRKAARHE